ncbi:MAG: tRNA pseudouridine(38-40) synthase TruA [Betaproteobacteria bacterium CG2_30_68_42]|nr:MAG: tRNA pseudouridine(38-40) synthase TruA [Betaproteobacteria bacterium CG2_30_68_42]
MRIALGLEYDGSGFFGWQSQPCGNTVQDEIERAIACIAGRPLRVHCAGRTDAGVHALAQVVHFDTPAERPLAAWVRGVNSHLPAAVAVRWAQPVADDFDARRCAISRSYCYVLLAGPVRPGLDARRVGWYHRPLDVERMRAACAALAGEHDFSAFRSSECQARSPVRTLHEIRLSEHGPYLLFVLRANAFLHHMVRNIVGALVQVGRGARPVQWTAELLASHDRRLGAATFSPAGLYLARVEYAPQWKVPGGARLVLPVELAPQ